MRLRPRLLLFTAPLVVACSTQPVDVGLNARVGAPRTGATGRAVQALSVPVTSGIDVSRVRLVVRELELEQEGDDSDDGVSRSGPDAPESEGEEREDDEFETGPFLIDLSGEALTGQLASLPGLQVPAGSYDEIEFEVGKLNDEEAAGNPGLMEMEAKNATVIIDGTIDGEPFSFVSGLWAEQEREARFTVDAASGASVTFNLDPSRWFVDASGARLDPRDSGVKSTIESNIKASIDAFDDEDEDGAED